MPLIGQYLLPDPHVARAKHGAGDRHDAHVGHAARVVGRLHALAAHQQLLQAVLLGQLRHLGLVNGVNEGLSLVNINLFQSRDCETAGTCRLATLIAR